MSGQRCGQCGQQFETTGHTCIVIEPRSTLDGAKGIYPISHPYVPGQNDALIIELLERIAASLDVLVERGNAND